MSVRTCQSGVGSGKFTNVFAANGLDYVIRWRPEQFRDNRELVHVYVHKLSETWNETWWWSRLTILSRKEGLSLEHLSENASRAPNVDSNIVFLPREHDLGGPIITRRHVASHLRILYSGKSKVTYLGCCAVSQRKAGQEGSHLEITILVHEDVARFLW
jgi:hypothetical protein